MDKFFNLDKSAETRRTLHTHTHTGSFLKTIFLIFMLCPVSVFATDVAGGETCDTNVLNTDTGPVNLRAEFEPETIDLRWYNSNTLLNVTSAQGECTYDSPITLPTDPVKPGYKFKGWKVRPEYDFSTLSIVGHANAYWAKNQENVCDHRNYEDVFATLSICNDLNVGEFKVTYNFGTFWGQTLCSTTRHTELSSNTPSGTYGENCYCKITGYTPNNSTIKYASSIILPWIFYINFQGYDNNAQGLCSSRCANFCSLGLLRDTPNMINSLLGS